MSTLKPDENCKCKMQQYEQEYYKKNMEAKKAKRREYYRKNKEAEKRKRREYYEKNKDKHRETDNERRKRHYEEHKEEHSVSRRCAYNAEREEAFGRKGNFATDVSSVPCDTTEYELALSPETAVMNWYQCVGNWRLQWVLEDIQDLRDGDGDESQLKSLEEELKRRLLMEKVTPEKQQTAANEFFRAIGRGCSWGDKPTYDEKSVDARLFGCACCGMKEYDDVGEAGNIETFHRVPLSQLSKLQLAPEDAQEYERHLEQVIEIPTNEERTMKKIQPWLVKSVYPFAHPNTPEST